MKTTVHDICSFMETWAPPAWAYPWDRIGLHTGCPAEKVKSVMVCLTVTPSVVAAAIRNNISMIVSHHPLIWNPLKTLRSDNPNTQVCIDLCRANIACFIAHTNLDVAPNGVNAALAAKLQLQETRVLFKEEHLKQTKLITFVPEAQCKSLLTALAEAGAGIIGNYSHCSFHTPGTGTFLPNPKTTPCSGQKNIINEKKEIRLEMRVDNAQLSAVLTVLHTVHPYEEPAFELITLENENKNIGLGLTGLLDSTMRASDFVGYVRRQLSIPHAILYGTRSKKINRVAVLGGSGGDYVDQIPANIDAYITGDIGYHQVETARLSGLTCIDATHYGTELPIVDTIAKKLRKNFPAIRITT
ncbi:MAG: Nif3-like dinuclear metal center hexameric protein, partial [Candidatus Hydrogenedentes bacterium]|nr:Nif3-like dinuclear metal center hexameric protein [Candidatus Hydrogenedentota bacterium]